jgi:hypothetical protein
MAAKVNIIFYMYAFFSLAAEQAEVLQSKFVDKIPV